LYNSIIKETIANRVIISGLQAHAVPNI